MLIKVLSRISIILIFMSYPLFSIAKEFELKLCYPDNDAPPWQIGNGDHVFTPPGLSLDIISKAASNLNIKVIYSRVPTNRVFNTLKKNEVDGAFIFSFLEERLEYGFFPMNKKKLDHERRIATMIYSFYKRKDSNVTWDGKKLSNTDKVVGVNRGYAVIDVLKKLQIPYEESKGTEILLKKLDSARISTCIGQSITVDYFIKKLKLTNIVKIKPDVISKDYFLIFSQKFINEHKNIAEKLWSEIGKVRDFEIQKKILTYEN